MTTPTPKVSGRRFIRLIKEVWPYVVPDSPDYDPQGVAGRVRGLQAMLRNQPELLDQWMFHQLGKAKTEWCLALLDDEEGGGAISEEELAAEEKTEAYDVR